jgi:hypothetical protein
MKFANSFGLVACLFAMVVGATGCASDFAGNESDAPPADPQVGIGTEASPHFKGGKNAKPSFTDLGLALKANGSVSGLGNGDVTVNLTAVGQPKAVCQNPGSGIHEPPGQNPAEVTLGGTQAIPASDIKNGTLSFGLQTGAPPSPVEGAPECPSGSWTEIITDVAFTSAHITMQQNGATVLDVTCTFSPATSNGAVPANTVTCK